MRVVKASAEILDWDDINVAQRIEAAGRVAYQSQHKITEDSAGKFCRMIIERGHDSVLEFGMLVLIFDFNVVLSKENGLEIFNEFMHENFNNDSFSNYIEFDIDKRTGEAALTASVRVLRQIKPLDNIIVIDIFRALKQISPNLFFDIPVTEGLHKGIVQNIGRRDDFIPVLFNVSRGVSHQLVRHRKNSVIQESQRYCNYSQDRFSNQITFIEPSAYNFSEEEYRRWEQSCEYAEKHYFKLLETQSPQAARTVLPNSTRTKLIIYADPGQWRHIFSLRCSPAADPAMREVMIPLEQEFKERGII